LFVFFFYFVEVVVVSQSMLLLLFSDSVQVLQENIESMFTCPLFLEHNKTAKLNINTVPTVIGVTRVLELCGLNLPK